MGAEPCDLYDVYEPNLLRPVLELDGWGDVLGKIIHGDAWETVHHPSVKPTSPEFVEPLTAFVQEIRRRKHRVVAALGQPLPIGQFLPYILTLPINPQHGVIFVTFSLIFDRENIP